MANRTEDPEKEIDRVDAKDEKEIYDWLTGFGSRTLKVTLKRTYPMTYKGVMVKGTIGHYDQPISDEGPTESVFGARDPVYLAIGRERLDAEQPVEFGPARKFMDIHGEMIPGGTAWP